ncbi:hypothetical protein K0M31_004140 [Melipona bicolor]|uniref:Uncharacterized protein n=1 Tax=Melipona bicolor TaxID=60889 RepID=A0AA40FYA8_9HYME|nr:hypothetical protein K0M31_004140 [Melipona bicolor]
MKPTLRAKNLFAEAVGETDGRAPQRGSTTKATPTSKIPPLMGGGEEEEEERDRSMPAVKKLSTERSDE